MKSIFSKCYFRNPLQLRHYKPNNDAFSQTTLYTQYSGKILSWGGVGIWLCVVFWMHLGTDLILSLGFFCLVGSLGFFFFFWNTKQLVCSKVVALLTCRSGLRPCRQLRKGNNATLCPDLSLPSLIFGSSQMHYEKGVLWTEFPLLSGVTATWSERIQDECEMLGLLVEIWLLLWMSLAASKQKKKRGTIRPQSANIKPCECDTASLQTCEYLNEMLPGLWVDEVKFINAKQPRQVLSIWKFAQQI